MIALRAGGVIAVLLALAGCGDAVRRPRGVGTGADDLGRSPCACIELPARLPPGTGAPGQEENWQEEMLRALGRYGRLPALPGERRLS